MIQYIRIGGQDRPVAFGHKVSYDYEINTGKSYNELLLRVGETLNASAALVPGQSKDLVDIEVAASVLTDPEKRRAVAAFSVVPLTDLVYYGMVYAHRKERIPLDFEAADVAEWLFGDFVAMGVVVRLLFDSLPDRAPRVPGENDIGKKKTMSHRPASTGTRSSKPRR